MRKRLLSILAFATYSFVAFAQFAGGSGTKEDPYLISDAYQLSDMRNYRTSYFKLSNDIDLTEWIADNSPSAGWMPVGTSESPFSGFLDGNNCTIRGLVINRPETSYIGLFGYVKTSGTIVNNLNIEKPSIKGYNFTGTIVGCSYGQQSNMLNCRVTECSIEGNNRVGGIGGLFGNVTDSYVSVKKIQGKDYCGGIAGVNLSCYNCNILAESIIGSEYVGGVSGSNIDNNNCNVLAESIIGSEHVGGVSGSSYNNNNCHAYINEIEGSKYVGGISGYSNYTTENCSVIASEIKGSSCGGVIGYAWSSNAKVKKCYAAANIIGGKIGGIVGYCYCYTSKDTYSSSTPSEFQSHSDCPITNCRFDGNLISNSEGAGGILGYSRGYTTNYKYNASGKYTHYFYNGMNIYKCISIGGSISDKENVAAGICCSTNGHTVENCVSVYNSISGTKAYRIADPDGDNKNNLSSIQTKLFENSSVVTSITDNASNGQAYGDKTLKRASTYTGLGWDLVNDWKIVEGEEYPYPAFLSPYPTVTNFENVSKCVLYGSCPENGKLYVFRKGARYETDIVDNTFEINVGAVSVGDTLCYYAQPEGKCPSIVRKIVIDTGNDNPSDNLFTGDANGDDMVDAADVVSIINCILGRPAANFVRKNADINGDGQILVDDAVGTVNLIMSNQ